MKRYVRFGLADQMLRELEKELERDMLQNARLPYMYVFMTFIFKLYSKNPWQIGAISFLMSNTFN